MKNTYALQQEDFDRLLGLLSPDREEAGTRYERIRAGVHWRSDGTESLKLGEAIAISVLRDQKLSYNEVLNGFSLTRFGGTSVTV